MWNGPIHDPQFVGQILEHLEDSEDKYGTATRMKGMLTVAKEVKGALTFIYDISPAAHRGTKELPVPFYFTPSRVASFFHCICPSLNEVASVDSTVSARR